MGKWSILIVVKGTPFWPPLHIMTWCSLFEAQDLPGLREQLEQGLMHRSLPALQWLTHEVFDLANCSKNWWSPSRDEIIRDDFRDVIQIISKPQGFKTIPFTWSKISHAGFTIPLCRGCHAFWRRLQSPGCKSGKDCHFLQYKFGGYWTTYVSCGFMMHL